MLGNRYTTTEPVKGGYEYYNVVDTKSQNMQDFAVVTIHSDTPMAKDMAQIICGLLNVWESAKP